MPYPNRFLRLQVAGSGWPGEIWSWSLNLIAGFGQDAAQPADGVPAGVVSAVTAFHQEAGLINNRATLETIKLNLIGTDGRYVNQSTTYVSEVLPPVTGAGTLDFPPQVALTITLRTSAKRGRAHAGRFFLPYPALPLDDTTGMLGEEYALIAADAAARLINALNASAGARVGVVSELGTGEARTVTSVEVGRAYDTIRRRRNQLEELYKPASVAIAPA